MRELIIGFSTHKNKYAPFSLAIRAVQGTDYSHVYVRTESKYWNRSYIYQASGTKVNMVTLPVFLDSNVVLKEFRIQVPDETYKKVVGYAMDKCGKDYGVFQILGLVYVLAAKRVCDKNIKNPIKDGFICSELVAILLRELSDQFQIEDFLYENKLTYDTITPKDIDLLLSRYFKAEDQTVFLDAN